MEDEIDGVNHGRGDEMCLMMTFVSNCLQPQAFTSFEQNQYTMDGNPNIQRWMIEYVHTQKKKKQKKTRIK